MVETEIVGDRDAVSGAPSIVPIIAPDRMETDAESVGRRWRVAS
jgi:hypothetical protein